jgi:hypothetical protein
MGEGLAVECPIFVHSRVNTTLLGYPPALGLGWLCSRFDDFPARKDNMKLMLNFSSPAISIRYLVANQVLFVRVLCMVDMYHPVTFLFVADVQVNVTNRKYFL